MTNTTTATRRPVVPADLTRIRGVSEAQISPDGRRVAFVVTTASEDDDAYRSSIWVVETAGGEPRRFTTGPRRDTAPRWSPDGTRLAFVSDRDSKKKPQLYVMLADGGEPTRITDLPNGVHGLWGAVWSPDGTRLALTSKVGGWKEPEDEKERGKSRPARVITTLKYKYDGEGFTHDRRPHVFVVSAEGGEPRQLTRGDFPDAWPAWSPDGTLIVFASERHETRDDDGADDVFIVPADGGELHRLTDTAGPMWYPMFSPDGRSVVYVGHPYPRDDGRNARLYTVPLDGAKSVCLTESVDRPAWDFTRPVWSADGEWMYAVFRDRARYPVYRVRAKGGEPASVFIGGERTVTGLSVARATGQIAFTATDPRSPAEVFVCHADGTSERQLTNMNAAWKAEVELSGPERFTFNRAGFDIDGWVMKPCRVDPARRSPALLWIHGGPHREFGYYFSLEFQVYAGAGYAVVYTNPRGSQGYGEAFSRAVVGDWGGGDFADIMAGLDEALGRSPFVDADRLGIMGISYGGYMTNWAIAHTSRFKAACAEGSISNIHTQVGTSDIGHIWTVSESGGSPPWERPTWYVEHSPLTYVTRVETPLLIVHAEQDLRCPIDQAEQMFVALKKLGRDVTFVRFPDESHTFSATGTPQHRLERYRLILEWFDTRLTPGR